MPHSIKRIRTIALVGQSGSGKTSLAEALLAKAGAVPAAGSVERGTTVGDYTAAREAAAALPEARRRSFDCQDTRIHLLDTPGYPDFLGHALPALAAVETAAIVINAQNGIEMMTGRFLQCGGEARPRPPDRRQQDRRRQRRPRGPARAHPGGVRQGMPAAQPAGGRAHARSRTASSRPRAKPTSPRSRKRTASSSTRWSRSTRS